MKCKRNSDGRKLDHHTLQVMRQQAVKAVREGQMQIADVATAFGVNSRTISKWLAAFANGGQNALLAKPIPGRKPIVTNDEMHWIAEAVRDNTPLQFKFEFGLWTLAIIADLIKHQFGKSLSLGAVGRIMKVLGFTVQKPLREAWQQDPVLVREWETKKYPAIKEKAKSVGAKIYFADEAGIRADYHAGTTWGPVGQTPVVSCTGARFRFNMISAVGPKGDFRFMIHDGSVNANVFKQFLQLLMIGETSPVFVIVDGHSIHTSKIIKEYVASTKGMLEIFILPPYSPHLNPDELVWAHVKTRVSKKMVQTKENMKELAIAALERIQSLPDLVKSFFKQQECRYAA